MMNNKYYFTAELKKTNVLVRDSWTWRTPRALSIDPKPVSFLTKPNRKWFRIPF